MSISEKTKMIRAVVKKLEDDVMIEFCFLGPYTICVVATETGPRHTAMGVAKWNPNDKGKGKWDYSEATGKRISKPRAIANLAEDLYELYYESMLPVYPSVEEFIAEAPTHLRPRIEIQIGHLLARAIS